jgi:glycosyltransferase involved in cell wall biosynthesis
MPQITSKVPNAELLVAGDGMMKEQLKTLVSKLGINHNVRFVGFIEEHLKPLYYKSADVFCLPSTMTTESFGIVNLEAMASGLPIVASRIGGIPDVLKDGENGLLVPPRDHEALANAIVYLLENEDMRSKMSENGREFVKSYTWNRIAEAYEMVYRKVIE